MTQIKKDASVPPVQTRLLFAFLFVSVQYPHTYNAKCIQNRFAMAFLHVCIIFTRLKQQVFEAVLNNYFCSSLQMSLMYPVPD